MKTKEEIEQLAESEYGTEIESIRGSNPYDLEKDRKNGFIKGYTQCQEDMADDLEAILNNSIYVDFISKKEIVKYLNSLNKQD
jgi:hypothetical protein